MKATIRAGALAAALSLGAGAAGAATVTYDFTAASSGTQTMLSYTVDGITLQVTTTGGNGKVQTWAGHGLGAPTDSHHQVDSKGIPETVNFSFSKLVKLVTVTFSYVQVWDDFALSQGGAVLATLDVTPSADVSGLTSEAASFGVGAVGKTSVVGKYRLWENASNACYKTGMSYYSSGLPKYFHNCYSAFKITSLTVDYTPPPPPPVPLPAAGWMLIAGLGGLAALRRRRKG